MFEKLKSDLILRKIKLEEKKLENNCNKINELDELKNLIDSSINELIRILYSEARQSIEFTKYKKSSMCAEDWQLMIVAYNNIFAIILGVIDARINDYYREINYLKKFNKKDNIDTYDKLILELREKRYKVLELYKQIPIDNNPDIILNVLEKEQSYLFFNLMSDSIVKNECSHNFFGELIISYMKGYNNSLYFDEDKIIDYFNDKLKLYKHSIIHSIDQTIIVKKLINKNG